MLYDTKSYYVISIKITVVKKDVIPSTIWWKGTNGKSYTITSKANGYYETSDACESVNGYLASIMNVKDQETVNIAIRKLKPHNETFLWIGKLKNITKLHFNDTYK